MHHSFNKYTEHKNKSASLFKRITLRFVEQQRQFQQLMAAPSDQRLVLKEVIYSGRKRYETLYGDSSTRNSWRNHLQRSQEFCSWGTVSDVVSH